MTAYGSYYWVVSEVLSNDPRVFTTGAYLRCYLATLEFLLLGHI